MKRFILGAATLALAVSCAQERVDVGRLVDNYALVTIPAPDLTGITDNGKEVLRLYRMAADEVDKIYWKQYFGDGEAFLGALADPSEKLYAEINYGPWDRIDGKPFLPGYGAKPAGACFYPADMTAAEFDAFADPAKHSPYTLVQRADDGSLKTDDYYESDKAWLEMTDSKMDLVLGPNEAVDDALYGTKASYGAYVLLKNLKRTEELNALSARMPEFQQMLPGDPADHDFVPGAESDIFSCNVLYCSGYTNAGFKVIGINFPYDAKIQEELGTRTIIFDNIIREKFNRTVYPVGKSLLEDVEQPHVDASAFYWIIVFREVAKGLGVKETVNGKGTVAEALGNEALVMEKAKSNVLGTLLCAQEAEAYHISAIFQKEDVLATFVANTIRSTRFGAADPTGIANILVYNYLLQNKAIIWNPSGRYSIDYDKTWTALETLGAEILRIQAHGDIDAARACVEKYGVAGLESQSDKRVLEKANIPVDLRFAYE